MWVSMGVYRPAFIRNVERQIWNIVWDLAVGKRTNLVVTLGNTLEALTSELPHIQEVERLWFRSGQW